MLRKLTLRQKNGFLIKNPCIVFTLGFIVSPQKICKNRDRTNISYRIKTFTKKKADKVAIYEANKKRKKIPSVTFAWTKRVKNSRFFVQGSRLLNFSFSFDNIDSQEDKISEISTWDHKL